MTSRIAPTYDLSLPTDSESASDTHPRRTPKGARRPADDVTVLEVAELMYILRIGRTRAHDLINSLEITHYREGRAIRIPVEAVREYQAGRMKRRVTL